MRRRLTTMCTIAGFGLASGLLGALPASASSPEPAGSAVAAAGAKGASASVRWSMSPRGNTVSDPSSGLSLKLKGDWSRTAGGVQFAAAGKPSQGVSDDGGRLSPGWDNFAVAVNLTTSTVPTSRGYSPNVVQKGFYGVGGQWKMQLHPTPKGTKGACRFEGSKGMVLLRDASGARLDDGRAHVVACWRQAGRLGISVDGHDTVSKQVVGRIKPRAATTVANKKMSVGVQDQFRGSITCIAVTIGGKSRDLALSRTGC